MDPYTTMCKTKELSEHVSNKILVLHKPGMGCKTISRELGEKVRLFVNGRNKKMTINRPQSGAPWKILRHGVRMNHEVGDQPKTTLKELVNDLKAVWEHSHQHHR